MDCPACKDAMITLELSEVEIDYCTECNGVWLDSGELELLFGDAQKAKDLISSFRTATSADEKSRKCPICDKKMEEIVAGAGEPALLVDRCVKGDGLWFDRGELNEIIERAKLDADNKIKHLLAEIFGEQNDTSDKN